MKKHTMTALAKTGPALTTDEGQDVPERALHSWTCSCGERCDVWYAQPARARASFDRHLGRVAVRAEAAS